MRYERNDKHKQPWQRGRRGSLCPADMDLATAQNLLQDSEAVDGKRYAVHEGRAYCAQEHGADVWHGYPVGWVEAPGSLLRRWLEQRRMRRRDVTIYWNG